MHDDASSFIIGGRVPRSAGEPAPINRAHVQPQYLQLDRQVSWIEVTVGRLVPMLESASFPSGHAASAFAFAYSVGRRYPALAVPIRLLASGVAYSRVHTGVHYPGDVVLGSVLGAGTSAMVAGVRDRRYRSSRRRGVVPGRLLRRLPADRR
ncbi:phosphatase PAP2 family protein [Nocardia sp. NPDC051929]|uniref:phosphatase PAP2 family protein n=1 Tax=unclassified Nocardia TaxID=2637762 RepID=UPI003428A868